MIINVIYVAIGTMILGLLFWYGSIRNFSFQTEMGGGEAIPFLTAEEELSGSETEVYELPQISQPDEPDIPDEPDLPPLQLPFPDGLVFGMSYRYESVYMEFFESSVFRLSSVEDESLAIECGFTVLSEAVIQAEVNGEIFEIIVGYRLVTICSEWICERFDAINPLFPGELILYVSE